MSNEMNVEGIRLAYVHLSVTTPRAPAGRVTDAALARKNLREVLRGRVERWRARS